MIPFCSIAIQIVSVTILNAGNPSILPCPIRCRAQRRFLNIHIVSCAYHHRGIVLARVTANHDVGRTIQPFQLYRRGNRHLSGGQTAVGILGRDRIGAVTDTAKSIRAMQRIRRDMEAAENIQALEVRAVNGIAVGVTRGRCTTCCIHSKATIVTIIAGHVVMLRDVRILCNHQ